MKTLDLKKEYKYLYAPLAKKVEIVRVPCLQFAMIDGSIDKGSEPGNSPSLSLGKDSTFKCLNVHMLQREISLGLLLSPR